MAQPGRAQLFRTVIMAMLLLLPACGGPARSPTATPVRAFPPATPATPARPTAPGTPASPRIAATPESLPSTPTTTRQATPPTGAAAILSRLPEATALTIQDDWNGLSPTAPVERHFSLYRGTEHFAGPGRMVVQTRELVLNGKQEQRIWAGEATVPLDAMQAFLQLLATVPLREGAYKPAITHTDDYPAIDILIATPVGAIWFFTTSNDRDNVPWGAVIGDRTYVIDSPIPSQALGALDSYLSRTSLHNVGPAIGEPVACRADAPPIKPVTSVPAPAKVVSPHVANPSAAPEPRPGETVNLATRHGLRSTQSVWAYAMGSQTTVEDPALVEQFLGLLDQPLTVVVSTSLGPSYFDHITLVFLKSATSPVTLHYHVASDEVYVRQEYSSAAEILYAVRAPAGFGALLLSQLCGG